MNWNEHWHLRDKHAFLGASQHSWVNYTPDKLQQVWHNMQAKAIGTRLHFLASEHIKLGIKMPQSKKTLNSFVNDAIGYKMRSEQILYYSDNCFGTADAISYKERTHFLRIHDLKTGAKLASMVQLEIYAAIFCLEYHIDPNSIGIELRIYQNDDIIVEEPDPVTIIDLMHVIMDFDKILVEMQEEEGQ